MKGKKQFRHHPDGWIYINDIVLKLEDFVRENPDYKLPRGWIGREYIQGEMNRVYSSNNEKFLDKEWEEGDKYLKDYERYAKIREEAIKSEEKERERELGKLNREQK